MGSISNYLENAILNHVLKVAPLTQPTNIYIALSTADPTEDGSGIAEPGAGAYARKAHNVWTTAAARVTYNTGAIEFAEATAAWGKITHFAIFDAITGGNMLAYGELPIDPDVVAGNNVSIKDGQLSITKDPGMMSNYLANAILDHVFKNDAFVVPTNLYVALATATITDVMTGTSITEPTVGGYTRILCNTWDAAALGVSANTGAITFPEATAAQGSCTYGAILDALTGGNMLFYGALTVALDVVLGTIPNFPAGTFSVTLD